MIPMSAGQRLREHARSFSRYFVAGGISTGVHYLILICLVELAALDETVSTALGYAIASVLQYHLLYHWTFASNARHKSAFMRFAVVSGAMLVTKTGCFWILVELIGLWYLYAQVIVTAASVLASYLVSKAYIFTRH